MEVMVPLLLQDVLGPVTSEIAVTALTHLAAEPAWRPAIR
jgi:hypothetical protein